MEFNTGDFVNHSHYGVGRIEAADGLAEIPSFGAPAEVLVKFQDGELRTFTSELLERSANKISPLGFRAYAFLNEASAKELLASNPVEAIVMVLQDFPGFLAKNEDLKDYLSGYVPDWAEWWETVQPKLKASARIDTSRTKFREYGLQRDALSPAEEIYQAFHRLRPFQDKVIVYNEARRTLAEYSNGSSLAEEHLQDVLDYLQQIIEIDTNAPELRLDAVFRLQEGKWLTNDQVSEYISRIIKSGVKLYDLDLFSLNRLVEFLMKSTLSEEEKNLLASSICAGEITIKALSEWALKRGDSAFIARLLVTALSENIPPQLESENLNLLVVRLEWIEKLIRSVEIEYSAWSEIIIQYQNLVVEVAKLDIKFVSPLFQPLLTFSRSLYERIHNRYPELGIQILDSLINPAHSRVFLLGMLDSARESRLLSEFGSQLEDRLWSEGDSRNYDFIRELVQSKGSTVDQVKALLEVADQYESRTLKAHIGNVICELVKKDSQADPVVFLPHLNKLHAWGSEWSWSKTVEGLRESIYLDALERPRRDFGDRALTSAIDHFLGIKTSELNTTIDQFETEIQQARKRIGELENILAEREQVIRELRSGYGGDAAEARFAEKVRIVKEIASSVAEFERMELRSKDRSRETQAIILRLNNILAGLNVLPMEAIDSQVQFTPQKHQAVDASAVNPGETVTVVERGYLLRDNNDKLRLLKPALVKK